MSSKTIINNIPISTVIVAVIALLGFAYFLSRTSPSNANISAAQGNVDSMHSPSAAPSNELLNLLVGKPVPEIQLADKDGKTYSIAGMKGKDIVLFFNEGLMCYPACWNQMAAFGSDARFNSDSVQVISVITDSASDWQRAISQMPTLAKAYTMFDTGASASRQLGMLTTMSSMHRGQLPGHTYLIIDKSGIVRFVYDDPNMAIGNDMLYGKITALNGQ